MTGMILVITILLLINSKIYGYKLTNTLNYKNGFLAYRNQVFKSTTNILVPENPTNSVNINKNLIQKWFFLNYKVRSEVFVASNTSLTTIDIINEIYKNILISMRVLDNEFEQLEYVSIIAFPSIKTIISNDDEKNEIILKYETIGNNLLASISLLSNNNVLNESNDIQRKIYFHYTKIEENQPLPLLLCSIYSKRTIPRTIDFDDINDLPDEFTSIKDNNIPTFPFAGVYDFIADINKAIDINAIANSKFKYNIKDFKYDLKKMSKKKNPQELIDNINVKLTRLHEWKDVLVRYEDPTPNPFTSLYEWSEDVKNKYRTLKYLTLKDPKNVLDRQYNKKKIFLKLIEQWMDKLKRNFKFMYQPKRQEKTFKELQYESLYRSELSELVNLFIKIPYLDFDKTNKNFDFIPGDPSLDINNYLVINDRMDMLRSEFNLEPVLLHMFMWIDRLNHVQKYAYDRSSDNNDMIDSIELKNIKSFIVPTEDISLQVYSRGYVTERILNDLWTTFSLWDQQQQQQHGCVSNIKTSQSIDHNLCNNINDLSNNVNVDNVNVNTTDHYSQYLNIINTINEFTRNESIINKKSIQELYKDWHVRALEAVDWWYELIAEMNLEDQMNKYSYQNSILSSNNTMNSFRWSNIISDVVNGNEMNDEEQTPGSENEELLLEKKRSLWNSRYKDVIEKVEKLQEILMLNDHKNKFNKRIPQEYYDIINSTKKKFEDDLVTIPIMKEYSLDNNGFLFVIPRFFRDINRELELEDFLNLCSIIKKQLLIYNQESSMKQYKDNQYLEMIPMHPYMMDSQGRPDYSRKSPYPAILFYYCRL